MAKQPGGGTEGAGEPIRIKKYANRRLYNTATSTYVTLDHLAQMVKDGVEFTVADAKTGEDITRSVLTQIIVEEEAKGQNLLPISFLRQLIAFYGDSLQSLVPQYLEVSMESFCANQERIRQYLSEAFGGMFPFQQFDEMGRQNLAMFERTMKMFNPFHREGAEGATPGPAPGTAGAPGPTPAAPSAPPRDQAIEDLKAQLAAMQSQLDALAPKPKKNEN